MLRRVVEGARMAKRVREVIVATDDARIAEACATFGATCRMTSRAHATGTDRIAEVAASLSDDVIVNVQGDEPLIDPALVEAVAAVLLAQPAASMGTAAHAIDNVKDFANPNVVKVVLDARGLALYFSRAPIAWWRDGFAQGLHTLPQPAPLRHIGIYSYRVGFLRQFPQLEQAPIEITEALEQLRALWHGHRIAVHVSEHPPGPGVDTPEDLERVRALFAA